MAVSKIHWLVLLLIIVSLSLFAARYHSMQIPFFPNKKEEIWLIEARVDFISKAKPVLASLSIPEKIPGFYIINEQTASPGYGFSIISTDKERRAEWSKRKAEGAQSLYYKIQVKKEDKEIKRDKDFLSNEAPPSWEASEAIAARTLISNANQRSSTIESFTREIIKEIQAKEQNATLLLARYKKELLLSRLLTQADIPCRVVSGIFLEDNRRNQTLIPMIEVFTKKSWLIFNPETGEEGLPDNFLLWNRGGPSLLDLKGASSGRVSFSMLSQNISAMEIAKKESENLPLAFLGMHKLPIEQQGVFRLLLLLPTGTLVVVFMRILIGVRSSGTFMPVLLGMAFLESSLLPGLIYFLAIVSTGLLLRSYLSYLNLLLIARIASIIIIVIGLITISSLFAIKLGFHTGIPITAFPIIIIAWTIERMSILWEEEGGREVLIQGINTLFLSITAYALMQNSLIMHLSFNFPELNLIVVALIMLLGQYKGYRLLELRRFAAMKDIR